MELTTRTNPLWRDNDDAEHSATGTVETHVVNPIKDACKNAVEARSKKVASCSSDGKSTCNPRVHWERRGAADAQVTSIGGALSPRIPTGTAAGSGNEETRCCVFLQEEGFPGFVIIVIEGIILLYLVVIIVLHVTPIADILVDEEDVRAPPSPPRPPPTRHGPDTWDPHYTLQNLTWDHASCHTNTRVFHAIPLLPLCCPPFPPRVRVYVCTKALGYIGITLPVQVVVGVFGFILLGRWTRSFGRVVCCRRRLQRKAVTRVHATTSREISRFRIRR